MEKTNYDIYKMPIKEKTLYTIMAGVSIFTVGFIFYRSWLISLMLCPIALIYPKIKTSDIIKKRKAQLNIQFKDMLYSLSSSLSAGKSIEMAIKEVTRDLTIIYPDPNADINKELRWIISGIEMNQSIEILLWDFAKRSNIEDIYSFSDVFRLCNRSGGNLIEIIRNTSNIINDKIEIRQEIDTILAERKFEQRVLNILPILIILLLSSSAGDYIKPIFTTMPGRVVMSIALILFTISFYISARITDIKV